MSSMLRDMTSALRSYTGRRQLIVTGIAWFQPLTNAVTKLWRRTGASRTHVVAVIGSYGKTTTVRALSTVLCGNVHRYSANNAGFFVNHAILRIRPGQKHAVIEVGIDGFDQMAPYAEVIRPDIVVVTSIGSEHGRSFGTLSATRSEKATMVEALDRKGRAVLCGDDPNVLWMRTRTQAEVITFGCEPDNDYRAENIRFLAKEGTRFTLHWPGGEPLEIQTPLLGTPGIRAALATLAVGLSEGVSPSSMVSRLTSVEASPGRLQLVQLANGASILRDEYKSSYETIETALDVFGMLEAERKICVLGEVSEPPESQGKVYRHLGQRIAEVADLAILIGGNFQRYAAGARRADMPDEALIDGGRDVLAVIDRLQRELRAGDLVLLKGRDTQRLDRIALALQGQNVQCALEFCDAKVTRCHHCKML